MSRRTRSAALVVAAGTAIATLFGSASAQAEKIYGLVIGINDYQSDRLRDLHGAVNDANDIYNALGEAGATQVVRLLDGDANRAQIFAAWSALVSLADPGDTIVFSYAGHGAQQDERIAGSEEDGSDEMFQLHGYQRDASGNSERILDDEINALFRDASHLRIVFVADSCHSGTMTRSFDPRAGEVSVRGGGYEIIEDDQLPPASAEDATISETELEHVLFFGAVKDSQLVVELPVENQMRGVLSWAFAKALRGAADSNGDRVLHASELENFLRGHVRAVSEGRQLPQMARRARPEEIAMILPGGVAPEPGTPAPGASVATQPTSPTPDTSQQTSSQTSAPANASLVRLSILGTDDPDRLMDKLFDVTPAQQGLAELTWDVAAGEVISGSGDIVARLGANTGPEDIQPLIDKWLLLRQLVELAGSEPLDLQFQRIGGQSGQDNDATGEIHVEGTQLLFQVNGHHHENVTVFNLTMDGKLQYLIPVPSDPEAYYRGEARVNQAFGFPLVVQGPGPFGAEHLVVLSSPQPLSELHGEIERLHETAVARELRDILGQHLGGTTFQIGYVALFSAPK
jgi:hypothetical protein